MHARTFVRTKIFPSLSAITLKFPGQVNFNFNSVLIIPLMLFFPFRIMDFVLTKGAVCVHMMSMMF